MPAPAPPGPPLPPIIHRRALTRWTYTWQKSKVHTLQKGQVLVLARQQQYDIFIFHQWDKSVLKIRARFILIRIRIQAWIWMLIRIQPWNLCQNKPIKICIFQLNWIMLFCSLKIIFCPFNKFYNEHVSISWKQVRIQKAIEYGFNMDLGSNYKQWILYGSYQTLPKTCVQYSLTTGISVPITCFSYFRTSEKWSHMKMIYFEVSVVSSVI